MNNLDIKLSQVEQCKADIKQALIDKEVDMTGVAFSGYASKISELELGTQYETLHTETIQHDGESTGSVIDTGNNKTKLLFMGLRNIRTGKIQGSNDNATWNDIITGTTNGSNSGSTGTPSTYTGQTDYRYLRRYSSAYGNGNKGIIYWGIFAPTSN